MPLNPTSSVQSKLPKYTFLSFALSVVGIVMLTVWIFIFNGLLFSRKQADLLNAVPEQYMTAPSKEALWLTWIIISLLGVAYQIVCIWLAHRDLHQQDNRAQISTRLTLILSYFVIFVGVAHSVYGFWLL